MAASYRHRNAGLVTAALYGSAHFQAAGRKGGPASLSLYGDSDAARSLRAGDIRRKRTLTERQWATLMRERSETFGIPVDRLLPSLLDGHKATQ